jgi:hypothetical protein
MAENFSFFSSFSIVLNVLRVVACRKTGKRRDGIDYPINIIERQRNVTNQIIFKEVVKIVLHIN